MGIRYKIDISTVWHTFYNKIAKKSYDFMFKNVILWVFFIPKIIINYQYHSEYFNEFLGKNNFCKDITESTLDD